MGLQQPEYSAYIPRAIFSLQQTWSSSSGCGSLLPIGYVRALDGHMDLRNERRGESRVAFMGHWRHRKKSIPTWLNQSLVTTRDVHSVEALKDWVAAYPIHLNIHQWESRLAYTRPAEAFRFSQLLSNKACVVSDRSSDLDDGPILHYHYHR